MNAMDKVRARKDPILKGAAAHQDDIVRFLRDLIAIPATSCQEGPVIRRIEAEMKKVGFDEVRIDGLGNVLGRIGSGKRVIMMDSHTDTVGVGDPKEWTFDPYQGKVEGGCVWGRGASDQRAGIACLVYAGKLIKDLGLTDDFTVWMCGSVEEEDSDGIGWLYILREDGIEPDAIVITEPTNLRVYRGHRGRMEIEVHVPGVSCHASAPERGVNPIYKATHIIQQVEALNERLARDAFLGKGTIAVTDIRAMTPSQCAVPSSATFHLDRRLTAGETKESAVAEIKALPALQDAEVEVLQYKVKSWRGLEYGMEKYYPTWVLDEQHPLVRSGVETHRALFGAAPVVDKWVFSTNGVATMGIMKVPTIGFGPGEEDNAHSALERVPIEHLVKATAFYTAFPLVFQHTLGPSA
ncbi:MAG TPA: YgeY family selenium metabolism-linked hydrolase [Gemmatimonadales bacterium]|nr:YgeY family selenium metabolism-linked hydrolase [Gemmatimonadales bacterium]